MKRIAVLTSGGDAPGMNAAIRAVVRTGIASGLEVVGIRRGYAGLLDEEFMPLDRSSVVNVIQRGGTMLGTARSERFRSPEGVTAAVAVLATRDIDGVVLIGGDGTFRGAVALAEAGGPPAVGIPGTIDNDVFGTDRCLGFDTAVNTALDSIDRIRDTATSHELLHFVEVMGRHSGWLAATAGLAGGAEAVLVPERPDQIDELCDHVAASVAAGKRSVIVAVAEGDDSGGAAAAATTVGRRLGLDYRVTTLGHVQRGGSPTASDRILGGMLGVAAVDLLVAGRGMVMLGEAGGAIVETPFDQTWTRSHNVPTALLDLVRRLG